MKASACWILYPPADIAQFANQVEEAEQGDEGDQHQQDRRPPLARCSAPQSIIGASRKEKTMARRAKSNGSATSITR